jgi:hypothetical protein
VYKKIDHGGFLKSEENNFISKTTWSIAKYIYIVGKYEIYLDDHQKRIERRTFGGCF